MGGIRKVRGSPSFPSKRISSDPLQPEGQDKDFSIDMEKFDEVSKSSVNEMEGAEFYQVVQQRKRDREEEKKKKREQKEEPQTEPAESEEEDKRNNKVDVLI
jgi:hypothetical protein